MTTVGILYIVSVHPDVSLIIKNNIKECTEAFSSISIVEVKPGENKKILPGISKMQSNWLGDQNFHVFSA